MGGKLLTFEIEDELYELLQQSAKQQAKSIEDVVVEFLASTASKQQAKLTREEGRAALKKLLRHAGAVNSGDPEASNNDRIDADLAREYGSAQEEDA